MFCGVAVVLDDVADCCVLVGVGVARVIVGVDDGVAGDSVVVVAVVGVAVTACCGCCGCCCC